MQLWKWVSAQPGRLCTAQYAWKRSSCAASAAVAGSSCQLQVQAWQAAVEMQGPLWNQYDNVGWAI